MRRRYDSGSGSMIEYEYFEPDLAVFARHVAMGDAEATGAVDEPGTHNSISAATPFVSSRAVSDSSGQAKGCTRLRDRVGAATGTA